MSCVRSSHARLPTIFNLKNRIQPRRVRAATPQIIAIFPSISIPVSFQRKSTVISARYEAGDIDLAMTPEAYTGLTSWLEAAPPGRTGQVT